MALGEEKATKGGCPGTPQITGAVASKKSFGDRLQRLGNTNPEPTEGETRGWAVQSL